MVTTSSGRKHRILFVSDTPGHTAGYYVVGRGLSEAGFEVILTGSQLPSAAVSAAIQEGVDILAYRIMDRDPVALMEEVLNEFASQSDAPLPVIVGGIIGKGQADQLKSMGIRGVFRPGSKLSDIVECAHECIASENDGA